MRPPDWPWKADPVDALQWAEPINEALSHVAWPATVVTGVVILRKNIGKLIEDLGQRLTEVGIGPASAKFDTRELLDQARSELDHIPVIDGGGPADDDASGQVDQLPDMSQKSVGSYAEVRHGPVGATPQSLIVDEYRRTERALDDLGTKHGLTDLAGRVSYNVIMQRMSRTQEEVAALLDEVYRGAMRGERVTWGDAYEFREIAERLRAMANIGIGQQRGMAGG